MRVISRSRLRAFWTTAGGRLAEGPPQAWYVHVSRRSTDWATWADVKASFASASAVGNCVVFNIGGNKFRLVVRIIDPSRRIYVLRVMTHAEYDQSNWKLAAYFKVDAGMLMAGTN
jgi:mRNA interferase HigB